MHFYISTSVHVCFLNVEVNHSKRLLLFFRIVVLTFDAMAIDQRLDLCVAKDEVDGFIDLGLDLGRQPVVATNVLVFMVRCITTKWKQTIGYFFTGPSLQWTKTRELVMAALKYCSDVGLTVLGVICDQESSQTRLWRELGVTPSNPGFKDPVTGDFVFVLPDPVHLLKSIRNNLMNHPVEVSVY